MKNILLSILLILSVIISAQPTITNSEVESATLGQITASNLDITNLNTSPGSSGANITWDFAAYTSNNSGTSINTACPNTLHCDQFPTANRIVNRLDNNSYYNVNSNDAQALGSYNSILGSKTIYSDTKIGYKFPVFYGQTFTDTYSYYLQGQPDITTGTVTCTVDGYGTLIYAGGTYTNVLRIKKIDSYVIPNLQPGIPGYFTDEIYEWISENGVPLLSYRIATGTSAGVPTFTLKEINYTSSFTLSTNESVMKTEFDVFPNPAQDEININSKEKIKEIIIINTEGKLIKKINQNFGKIDIKNLTKGSYFMKITTNNGSYSKKFIKK